MTFEHRPARREAAPVLVGLSGPSGGGKTLSALLLARGMSGGKPFGMVDTENGRALHYADEFPEMQHGHLRAPFTPEAYTEAIQTFDNDGFGVIVVDSMSHEWDGEGGIMDLQLEEFKRMGGKESARMASWIAPKQRHKRFVQQLLQVRAHVILCLRAEDKVEMVKVNGKTEIRAKETLTSIMGWVPICERRLPFELTLSLLVLPDRPGVPHPIKLQSQHRAFVPLDKPLSEETGRQLAQWAAGTSSEGENRHQAASSPVASATGMDSGSPSDSSSSAKAGEDRQAADQPSPQGKNGAAASPVPLTLSEWKTAVAASGLTRDQIKAAGGQRFPGKTPGQLTDDERGVLYAELVGP